MRAFQHYDADSLKQAIEYLRIYRGDIKPVAGGTDLLGCLKDAIHPVFPGNLVNLKKIKSLNYIEQYDGGIRIGALSRLVDIEKSPVIKSRFALLSKAASTVASPIIRNMGTIAGNIIQEPRCWYYRHPENTFHCLRKGGKTCSALIGDNRYHSIFGAVRVQQTPCQKGCPAKTNIPNFMSQIRAGKMDIAARELLKVNPMAAVTGRVCPHFCQEECNRNQYDNTVAIRNVERYVGDYILDNASRLITPPSSETGRRIAIVGSGPAGLSCAYFLRLAGHAVTIFECRSEPGGMLAYAIPSYRLPKEVVCRVIESIQNIGVEIKTNTEIGKDLSFKELRNGFDAIFLASGAWGKSTIGLKGEELTQNGLEFLTNAKKGKKLEIGQHVVVIGGGNVAVDVAITAKRLGAIEVTMVSLEAQEEMPAHRWEIQQALDEGIQLKCSCGPSQVIVKNGQIAGLDMVRCTCVFNEEGGFAPSFDEEQKEFLKADQIILSVGQRIDLSYLDQITHPIVESDRVSVDKNNQKTNLPTVFAGGDATTGPATVIEAVASGQRGASAIDQIFGESIAEQKSNLPNELIRFSPHYAVPSHSKPMPMVRLDQQNITNEDAFGWSREFVVKEAERCFNCGCVAASPSDLAPALIALGATIETTNREIPVDKFFTAGVMTSTVLEYDELVTAIKIPDPGPYTGQTYIKFRLRQSIDFPIIGVAVMIQKQANRIIKVRIVFSAAAPIPLRAKAAESFLKNKIIDKEIAIKAARMAVKSAIGLTGNRYKVKICETLVKRALLAVNDETESIVCK